MAIRRPSTSAMRPSGTARGELRDVYFYRSQLKGHTEREYIPELSSPSAQIVDRRSPFVVCQPGNSATFHKGAPSFKKILAFSTPT